MNSLSKQNADFKELRQEGSTYVDKTRYIELLENSNDKYSENLCLFPC